MRIIRRGIQSIEVETHGRTHRFPVEFEVDMSGVAVVSCARISEVVRGATLDEALARMTEMAREHVERSWTQVAVKGA